MTRRIFISSASGALGSYRQAAVDVCQRLGLIPVHMEEFVPDRLPPVDVCRDRLETCDVVVLLLAHRYGSRPPDEQRSYTELEYDWAMTRGDVAVLPFVVEPNHPWPPTDIDQGDDREALNRLIARVSSANTVRRFTDVDKFREDLLLALRPFELDRVADEEPAGARLPTPPQFHAAPPYVGSAPFTGRASNLADLDEWGRSADPMMVVEAVGGIGKSALTWEWASNRAPGVIDGLAGRMWWSFYDGSASIVRFLREVLAYVTHRPMSEVRGLPRTELTNQVLAALRERPFLIVLDGFERLLNAYHRFDPSKLRDDEVEPSKRSMIDPQAEDVLRELTAVSPSKILISSRLLPEALTGRFGRHLPGVRHIRLPGLTDSDTLTLLDRVGVRGTPASITGFFSRLGNHSLLVGVVAGLVRDYRPDPGGFDRWLADPDGGGALALPELDLSQRRSHILATALRGLSSGSARVLNWISVLSGSVEWTTLEAINPFLPARPIPVEPYYTLSYWEDDPFRSIGLISDSSTEPGKDSTPYPTFEEARQETEKQMAAWRASEPVVRARAHLDLALKDLEERGLLWWDRQANSYDLHPIIRAYVHGRLGKTELVQANMAVRDYFQALPPEEADEVTSVEDLARTITIFRALVGIGADLEAADFWQWNLSNPLLIELGAYPTVVELLAPLEGSADRSAIGDLTIAYSLQGRYEEATVQHTKALRQGLTMDARTAAFAVRSLGTALYAENQLLLTTRAITLAEELLVADGEDPSQEIAILDARCVLATAAGDYDAGRSILAAAEAVPNIRGWHLADITYRNLWGRITQGEDVDDAEIEELQERFRSHRARVQTAELRVLRGIKANDLSAALTAAEREEQLRRNAGEDPVPAETAYLLARLNRTDEATAALEECLSRLTRMYPTRRPHHRIGQALWLLGRRSEAVGQAHSAYRKAWADGPPYHFAAELDDARKLMADLGEDLPDLPCTDPTKVKLPMEDEIRGLLARLS